MKRIGYVLLIGVIFLTSHVNGIESKGIEASGKISSVTIFLNKALVNREFENFYQQGLYTIKFSKLPVSLEDDSIRVAGKGTASVKILNVRAQDELLTEAFRREVQKSADELNRLEQEIKKWEDIEETLQSREEFLLNLSEKTAEAITQSKEVKPPSLIEWEGMLDFLEKQLNTLNDRRRETQIKLSRLREQKTRIEIELDKNKLGLIKKEKAIFIDLEVLRQGNLKISAEYIIPNANWVPAYDLRISSEGRDSSLDYGAFVNQETGEDWLDVDLTLSTAKPILLTTFPEIQPAYLSVASEEKGMIQGQVKEEEGFPLPGVTLSLSGESITRQVASNEEGFFEFTNLLPGSYDIEADLPGFNKGIQKGIQVYGGKISKLDITLRLSGIYEEITVVAQPTILSMRDLEDEELENMLFGDDMIREAVPDEAVITEQDISTSFALTHKESIVSGKDPQKVFIAQQPVEVGLDHYVVPKDSEDTFLRARIKNLSNIPYIPGKVSVFLDGMFVNSSRFPTVNPGESYALPVGVDDSIKVIRKSLTQVSKSKGLFRNKIQMMLGYAITAENFKKNKVDLTIVDQIPVSKSDEIEVEVDQITPQPVANKTSSETGILEWKLELAPGEKKTIEVRYRVIYPKNTRIEEWR